MSVDLGDLLRDAGGVPSSTPDPDEIWRRGRHRRRLRTLAASAGGVAVIAALVILPFAAGGDLQPVIEPLGQDERAPVGEDVGQAADNVDERAEAEPAESHDPTELQRLQDNEVARMKQLVRQAEARRLLAEQQVADEVEAQAQAEAESESESESESEADDVAPSPAPAPNRVNDPCAAHEGGEMRAFIDVVAPVEGQRVGGTLDLVGCSSVYEGTIQYRIVDAGGTVVLADFTTATAGGPEIGEFRVTVDLPTTGDLVVEVYWDDPATGSDAHPDGPERDLVRIPFRAG